MTTSWVRCGPSGFVRDATEWGWRKTLETLKTKALETDPEISGHDVDFILTIQSKPIFRSTVRAHTVSLTDEKPDHS